VPSGITATTYYFLTLDWDAVTAAMSSNTTGFPASTSTVEYWPLVTIISDGSEITG
jgi:hypothetical protein